MGLLRLLLALSVLSVHSGSILGCRFVGGQIAVQAFYIISGFYMSLILNEKYVKANNSFKLFITNRFLRLYPIYFVILSLTVLACIVVWIQTKGVVFPKFENYEQVSFNFFSFGYLILTNIILFGQDLVLFLGITSGTGNLFFTTDFASTHPHLYSFMFVPQAWSLSIELTFYLIAPLIVRKSLKFQGFIILLSFLLRCYIFNVLQLKNDPWTYRFFPNELLFFILGSVAYRLKNKIQSKQIKAGLSIPLLIYLIVFTVFYFRIPALPIDYSPFSLKEYIYFGSIMCSIPVLFLYFKKNKFENAIGELSYPVYISHMLIIMVFTSLPFVFLKSGLSVAIFTLVLSWVLNKLVSSPIEKFRQSRVRKNI